MKNSSFHNNRKYWFPAKRYGWGWGLPIVWQGWFTLGFYFSLLVGGAFAIPPNENPLAYAGFSFGLTALLIVVCYFKGEPPRWR